MTMGLNGPQDEERDEKPVRWTDVLAAGRPASEPAAASRRVMARLRRALREEAVPSGHPWHRAPSMLRWGFASAAVAVLLGAIVLLDSAPPGGPGSGRQLALRISHQGGGVQLEWDGGTERTFRVSRCYIRADLQACEDVTFTTDTRYMDQAPSDVASRFDLVTYRVTPVSDASPKS